MRCNKKLSPPRAPASSPYQFDYSRYDFDVVTTEVAIHYDISNRQSHMLFLFNSWNHLFIEQQKGIIEDFVLT